MFNGINPGYADKPHAAESVFTACFSSRYLNLASTLKNDGPNYFFLASHLLVVRDVKWRFLSRRLAFVI